MFVSTYLSDVVGDFRVYTNLGLCEVVNLLIASTGLLFSGYNIVRNSTSFEVCLEIWRPRSNNRLQAQGLDNHNELWNGKQNINSQTANFEILTYLVPVIVHYQ